MSNILAIDGSFECPNLMEMPMDAFFDEQNLQHQREADTLLLGARTYVGLKTWWPPIAEDPSLSPAVQHDPATGELHRETAVRNNELRKVVVSDSLQEADTSPWESTTTIVRRSDAHDAVRALKSQAGKNILTFGSRTLWNDLVMADLVDELHLMIGAAVVKDGTNSFAGVEALPFGSLELIDVVRKEESNNVLLKYALVRAGSEES